ncbi:MAG: AsmA family protein, partial [Saprospiraceae bacterium]|nr:AsmA family protein [Saprospiraceae bacterium]
MKKALRILFRLVVVIILLGIVAMIAIPFLYSDEIKEFIKEDINAQLDADVDFKDVKLSFFSSFPDLRCSLDEFSITGRNEFSGQNLVKASEAALDFDLLSIFFADREIQINEILIDQPHVNLLVLSDGQANYNISKSSNSDPATVKQEYSFLANLDKYQIKEGNLNYVDQQGGTRIMAIGIDHSGQGKFTQDLFDLKTKTVINKLSYGNKKVQYLKNDRLEGDLVLGIDLENGLYRIKENDLRLNALRLLAEGTISDRAPAYDIDLSISAPGNDFKEVLSMLPGAFTKGFEKINATGLFTLKGVVAGIYNGDTGEMPAIDLKLEIKDGTVKYPDIRGGISKIFTRGTIAGDLDNMDGIEIDIPEFRFLLDDEPFEARVHLENMESDPRFDGKIKGNLDLNLVHKLIPMEGVQELGGQISTDLEGKASFSQIQSGNINDLDFGGVASVDQLIYDVAGQPSIRIRTADVDLTPRSMDIKNLVGEYGKSDFTGTASVENFLALVMPETTMKGSFDLQSNNLDINQLLTDEEEGMEDTAEDS